MWSIIVSHIIHLDLSWRFLLLRHFFFVLNKCLMNLGLLSMLHVPKLMLIIVINIRNLHINGGSLLSPAAVNFVNVASAKIISITCLFRYKLRRGKKYRSQSTRIVFLLIKKKCVWEKVIQLGAILNWHNENVIYRLDKCLPHKIFR